MKRQASAQLLAATGATLVRELAGHAGAVVSGCGVTDAAERADEPAAADDRTDGRPYVVVGLSAGPHSTGLLAALAAEQATAARWSLGNLRAVHVHHGMHDAANEWAERAAQCAAALGVPLTLLRAAVVPDGKGPEAAARDARYAAVAADLAVGELFVTGHHRDDQAETIVLQLLRGTGAHGLRGMAARRPLGVGWLVRPGLGVGADQLANCASAAGLRPIDDPSNIDERLARGWLRARVAPLLGARHPRWADTVARAGAAVSDAVSVADEVAAADLARLLDRRGACSVSGLLALTPARRRLAVRAWLVGAGEASPPAAFHRRLLDECLHARVDGAAEVAVPGSRSVPAGAVLRRDRDRLYLLDARRARRLQGLGRASSANVPQWRSAWHPPAPLALPHGELVVRASADCYHELGTAPDQASVVLAAEALASGHWEVRLRAGGEHFRPAGRRRRSLRKWLSDGGLPPWERPLLPLLYRGGELVAVPGVGAVAAVAPASSVAEVGEAVRVVWRCEPDQVSPSAVAT